MHPAILLSRTACRLATAAPSTHLARTFSAKSGSVPPKKPAQDASNPTSPSPASDHANTHADTPTPPSAASAQNAPVDTPDVSGSNVPAAPSPTTLSLDFAPPEPGAERERTGAKSSKDSLSSIERRRRQLGRVSFGLFALGLLGGGIYLGREWSEDELVSRRAVRVAYHLPWCPLSLIDRLVHSTFSGRGSGAGFAMGSYDQPVLVNVRRTVPAIIFFMTRYSRADRAL